MKTKNILKGLIASLFLIFMVSSCDDYNEPFATGIDANREFSPIDVTAIVRNKTAVEIKWTVNKHDASYVLEFAADDPNFTTIYKSMEVTADQLPLLVQLEGETLYSIRVKAISNRGLEDSKWTVITASTLEENIFLPIQDGDIQGTQATLRWIPNSNVTQIVVTPGNITHVITPEEKTAGVATVTGLTAETIYTADLFNNAKRRGSEVFTTGIDLNTGIVATPTDDLIAIVNAAPDGAIIYLQPGDYTVSTGEITLNKSITLRGVLNYNKPKIHVKFKIDVNTVNLNLIDLDMDGTGLTDAYAINITGASTNYGEILISGCNVHDFDRSLVYGNAASSKLSSFKIFNSIITSVNTKAGADFIDFRPTYVASIDIKNSTFNACSPGRDFVRVDAAAGFNDTGLNTNVVIDACTLYKPSELATIKRILYVRFLNNTSTVKNTLITDTPFAVYSNQPATTPPTFSNNYYFNAPGFMDAAIVNNKPDASGTVADPKFVSAATGNFKVTNQTLIDKNVGDPRWLK